MKPSITLSNGRIVAHRDYLLTGQPYATEAYMLDGGHMTDFEWSEYCNLTAPKPKPVKPTWAQIKAKEANHVR
jgi:hypothetical protein